MPTSPEVQIIRRLAVGGMSELFLAHLLNKDGSVTPVVVKRLLEGAPGAAYFRREREALSTISSPHVVRLIHGSDSELILEYVDGPDLEAILNSLSRQGRTLPLPATMALFEGMLLGLRAIHEATPPLVHRDLSPSNVLLSRTGDVKLTDLGLVRKDLADEPTMPGLKGTLAYMAPEQLLGKPVDARADLYAFGLIAYEVLCGLPARPEGPCGLQELLQARSTLPAPPSSVRPGLRDAVDRAVLKALQPDPSLRPPSAQALLEDLRAALQVEPDRQVLARYASEVAQAPLRLERTLGPEAPRPRPPRRGLPRVLVPAAVILTLLLAAWVATHAFGPAPMTTDTIEDLGPGQASKVLDIPGDPTTSPQDLGPPPPPEDPGQPAKDTLPAREVPHKAGREQRPPGPPKPTETYLVLSSPQALHVTGPSARGLAPIRIPLTTEPQLLLLHAGPKALPIKVRVMPGPDHVSIRLGAPEGQYYQVSCGGKALGPTPTPPIALFGSLTCEVTTPTKKSASFHLTLAPLGQPNP